MIVPSVISVNSLTDYEDYTILCYDGFAIGSDGKHVKKWEYPKLDNLTYPMIKAAMEYRFASDWKKHNVTFEDIFMKYACETSIEVKQGFERINNLLNT